MCIYRGIFICSYTPIVSVADACSSYCAVCRGQLISSDIWFENKVGCQGAVLYLDPCTVPRYFSMNWNCLD